MDWKGLIGTFFTRVCNLSTLCFSHYYSIVTGVLPCLSSTAHGPNKCVLVSDIKITADLTSFGVWGLLELGNVLHQPWAVDSWQWMDDYERTKGFSKATPSCSLVSGQGDPSQEMYFGGFWFALSQQCSTAAVRIDKIDYSHMHITTTRDVTCPQYL